ncbi:MAG TPA: hypothetical protein VLJ16_13715 [Acidobacteriota bacterium]|nr:hypothetical protein [Acidobacteriota bacterium]
MKRKLVLTACLLALAAVTAAYGQGVTIKASVDFSFVVEGKPLPAGTYEFTRESSEQAFRVASEGKEKAVALVITRLYVDLTTSPKEPRVVFDKVGENYTLSEIWIPGHDGYVLALTKGKHEHKAISASR